MPDRYRPQRREGDHEANRARALALLGIDGAARAAEDGLVRWSGLFEWLPVAAALCDAQGGLRQLNRRARQLLELEQGHVEGCPFEAFVALPDDRARLSWALLAAQDGQPVSVGVMSLTAAHRRLTCRLELQALPAAPKPDRVVVTLHASEEPTAALPPPPAPSLELAGRDQQVALAGVARLTGHWVLLTDSQHRIIWLNGAFVAATGWAHHDALGRTPAGLLGGPNMDRARVRKLSETLSRGEAVHGELIQACTKDRRELTVRLDIHPLLEPHDGVSQFATVLTDVTQQAQDEAALRDSRAELSAIFDAEPDALLLLRRDGSVLRSNLAARRLLGLQDADGPSLRDRILQADHGTFERMVRTAVLGRGDEANLVAVRPSGERVPVRVHCVPVFGGGEVLRVLAVARDLSEELAAQAMRISHGIAEEASRAKTEFIARISHELRTPLNAIMGFAQLLNSEGDAPLAGRQRGHVAQVLAAGAHLSALINDLLDLSRIEGRTLEVQCVTTSLASVMERAVALFALLAQRRGVSVVVETPPENLQALVDSTRLTQVLANLLSNAVKYNHRGGWVRLRAGQNERPWIEVSDSGPGFSPWQREHLFEPFNRLGAEKGPVEGTGIGLAIAHQLVELMGGHLGLVDCPGASTAFRIELPPAHESAVGAASPTAGPAWASEPQDTEGRATTALARRVLYVEDDDVNTALIQCLFDSMPNWQLNTAASVQDGIERVRATLPDLVLLDMQLPDGTGLDVRAAMAQRPDTADIPCILVTADASDLTRQSALKAGCVQVQHKPLDLKQLRSAMASALSRRK